MVTGKSSTPPNYLAMFTNPKNDHVPINCHFCLPSIFDKDDNRYQSHWILRHQHRDDQKKDPRKSFFRSTVPRDGCVKQKTVAADGWGSYEKAEELVNYIYSCWWRKRCVSTINLSYLRIVQVN